MGISTFNNIARSGQNPSGMMIDVSSAGKRTYVKEEVQLYAVCASVCLGYVSRTSEAASLSSKATAVSRSVDCRIS